jgi:hypothetical protein
MKKPRGVGEQETKEMGAKWHENESMDPYVGWIPYLSSPASGSSLGTALHAHTACSSYPGAGKGA